VAGLVSFTVTVPARVLGRRGAPVVVAAGSTPARARGRVVLRLRLNALGRANRAKLRGTALTLRVRQGPRLTTRTFRLR
jgi:hypothetical protein